MTILVFISLSSHKAFCQVNTVPTNGVKIKGEENIKGEKRVYWAPGANHFPSASGVLVKENRTGKATTYTFTEKGAKVIAFDLVKGTKVLGVAAVEGDADGMVSKGIGWVKAGISAKSKVKYADQVVLAKDKDSFFITTKGANQQIGVGASIAGFGVSWNGPWTEVIPGQKGEISIFDIDAGLTKLANTVTITLEATVAGALWLTDQSDGDVSANAQAGALVVLTQETLPGY